MDQNNAPVVRVGDWALTILLLAIPIVNLVMLFVWGFGGGANPNKANFAKASLIWMLIGIVLTIIFYVMFGAAMFAMMEQYSY
jgi:glycopeptide antibiotics resistance protein